MNDLINSMRRSFQQTFGREPAGVALAPARVNLIGEHTDYNEGFVFPMAIDRFAVVAYAANDLARIRAFATSFDERQEHDLTTLAPPGRGGWFDYVAGTVWALGTSSSAAGVDLMIGGNVPLGAGLSSSAALELAVARAVTDALAMTWEAGRAARCAQRAENEFVGVQSGMMDQMASALSRKGTALLLDCRDSSFERVPLPDRISVVVMDTGTRRTLADSAYNERACSCERAVAQLAKRYGEVLSLRDVNLVELEAARGDLDDTAYRRARHVIEENDRTVALAQALGSSQLESVGRLMEASHRSLRDLYEVSSPALDAIVAAASRHSACLGARMTGAGFGGCAVAMVVRGSERPFVEAVLEEYRAVSGEQGELFVCRSVDGAHLD